MGWMLKGPEAGGSRGYPEQGSDVAKHGLLEVRGVGGRMKITRPRHVMKQACLKRQAGLKTRFPSSSLL